MTRELEVQEGARDCRQDLSLNGAQAVGTPQPVNAQRLQPPPATPWMSGRDRGRAVELRDHALCVPFFIPIARLAELVQR